MLHTRRPAAATINDAHRDHDLLCSSSGNRRGNVGEVRCLVDGLGDLFGGWGQWQVEIRDRWNGVVGSRRRQRLFQRGDLFAFRREPTHFVERVRYFLRLPAADRGFRTAD